MLSISRPVELGEDMDGLAVFGVSVDDYFIHDPYLSECGRFIVDPADNYGISQEDAKAIHSLNALLAKATDDSLDAGARTIQEGLGIPTGDMAGIYFSNKDHVAAIRKQLAKYLVFELQQAGLDVE